MKIKSIILIIFINIGLESYQTVNFSNNELQALIEGQNYTKILQRICPTRLKGKCFSPLENLIQDGKDVAIQIGKTSSHSGYSSKIYNYNNMFIVKHITLNNQDMLAYVINEINTGIKVKESITYNNIENLVPLEQCCSQIENLPNKSLISFFVRMPYYPMGSLREFIENPQNKETTKSLVWSLNIIFGLINGIMIIHNKGYAHRDIKPENILMKSFDVPMISDYGFTKKILDQTNTVLGTLIYIAPEVMQSNSYSSKADIFSLGMVFFEIFNVGFFNIKKERRNDVEIFCDKIDLASEDIKINQKVYCQGFKPLIDKMMEKTPELRYDINQVNEKFKEIVIHLLNDLTIEGKAYFQSLAEDFIFDLNNPLKVFMENHKADMNPKAIL